MVKMEYATPLISGIISLYVPFADTSTRIACSMVITQFLVKFIAMFGEKFLPRFKRWFGNSKNYVIITKNNIIYSGLIEYLYKNYNDYVKGCYFGTTPGNLEAFIKEIYPTVIKVEHQGNTIEISFEKPEEKREKNRDRDQDDPAFEFFSFLGDLRFESRGSINVIKDYINYKVSNNRLQYKV